MDDISYRQANLSDVPVMASILASRWGTDEFWVHRIAGYLNGEHHPQQALSARIIYVAEVGSPPSVAGLIAGHLTTRYQCQGELQWIHVLAPLRRAGTASGLLKILSSWFVSQHCTRVCTNVDPSNAEARRFYLRHSAASLNEHWMIWQNINVVLKD
jgi:hypothetical protein